MINDDNLEEISLSDPYSHSYRMPRKQIPYDKYSIQVNRLPTNLTPSQRLKLRKLNINHTITSHFNSLPRQSVIFDNRDEQIDDLDLFNVPNIPFSSRFSTCTTSTVSTATSSVFSSSEESIFSEDLNETDNIQLESAFKTESARICEEFIENRNILNEFKQVNLSMPSLSKPSCSLPQLPAKSPSLPQLPTQPVKQTKYQTFTRPSWLPPKSLYDKLKHQNQSENLINYAIAAEAKLQKRRLKTIQQLTKQRQKDISTTWEPFLQAKSYSDVDLKKIDECVWNGIDEEVRAKVWWKSQQLRKYRFNEKFCDYYFHETRLIQDRIVNSKRLLCEVNKCQRNQSMQQFSKLNHAHQEELNRIIHNLPLSQWINIFQEVSDKLQSLQIEVQLPNDKLIQIVVSFILYWHNQTNCDITTLSSISGIPNLAAIFYRTFKGNTYKTLITLCHIYQTKLPNMMLSYLGAAPEHHSIIASSISDYIHYEYDSALKSQLNRLYNHFKIQNVDPLTYLPNLVISLCSNLFNFELSSHIIDIALLSENNEQFLIQLILGYMKKIQHKLFGTKEEILNYLLNDLKVVDVGYEYEFIDTIKRIK